MRSQCPLEASNSSLDLSDKCKISTSKCICTQCVQTWTSTFASQICPSSWMSIWVVSGNVTLLPTPDSTLKASMSSCCTYPNMAHFLLSKYLPFLSLTSQFRWVPAWSKPPAPFTMIPARSSKAQLSTLRSKGPLPGQTIGKIADLTSSFKDSRHSLSPLDKTTASKHRTRHL